MATSFPVGGRCSSRFESVRAAFVENFEKHGELGAAFAVVFDGELVVDLWGGYADAGRTRPWSADVLTNVWSTTKGLAAVCFAILADRGRFSYDDRVAMYWPEFAAAGKARITIAQLLSHQAGLCGFEQPVTLGDVYNQELAERMLAHQAPLWEPGTQCGYHALTIGVLANALFKRIDGRTLASFVREELAAAHALDLYIGLPADADQRASEIVTLVQFSSTDANAPLSRTQELALANPVLDPLVANSDAWRRSPIPSVNGFAGATALAQLYGAFANDGMLKGRRLLGQEAIEASTRLRVAGEDLVLGLEARWAAGFLRNRHGIYGDNDSAFGHSGWGGSFAFADPQRRLGVAYVMNAMGPNLIGDPRGLALVSAVLSGFVADASEGDVTGRRGDG
jgi:CubicO group peptidase (beta-lactamase class C family)